jgi:sugar/nucleoside kinase (ribokinase family)
MPHILVVGSSSFDTLHFQNRTESTIGGAGLYTALAVHRSGCQVSMYGVRPDPIPESLKPLQMRLIAWIGPKVGIEKIPHFEISHDGDKASYLQFYVGEEEKLDTRGLPKDLSNYDAVHISALGKAIQSLKFAQACYQRGTRLISSGSFLSLIQEDPEIVSQLMDCSNIFFLNEEEALAFFGSLENVTTKPGKLVFITRGKQGATVVQGNYKTNLPAVPAEVLDPTGAGDTFCGATLANLMLDFHPIIAARKAMALASEEIEQVGPSALLSDQAPPDIPMDRCVRIDEDQVLGIAKVIGKIPEAKSFNFVSDYHPPINHPLTIDYFFVQTLQQFSFWETAHGRYDHPLIATIDGHKCKGSTYLSYAYMRPLNEDPEFFSPQRQLSTTFEETQALFQADDGSNPMPACELHLHMAQDYGKDMLSMKLTPQTIISQANQSSKPLKTFISILDHIGGYKEDPFRKKTNLLALILNERPERFLAISGDEQIQPVIDYHSMRFCLRTGLVVITDENLRQKVSERMLISAEEEWAIRYACYVAVQRLIEVSGLSMGAVDNITFSYNRKHCPEMTEPKCYECVLDLVCSHNKELFQPVFRTTFY